MSEPDVLRELQLIRREIREIADKARVVCTWLDLVEQSVLKLKYAKDRDRAGKT